jgi:hypothetical protein
MDLKLSKHSRDMLKERNILEGWVWLTISKPDREEVGIDDNTHYFKKIPERGGRILHIVVNPHSSPKKVVTVFFDRRVRG